jgi:putative SOS response-associated peptidase YedK
MCGRFTQTQDYAALARRFGLPPEGPELAPRYNLAPGQDAPVIVWDHRRQTRRLGMLRWGLVPPWADEPGRGPRPINARAEGLAEKRLFRRALARRRCLVPADGFYEWTGGPGGKQPYLFRRVDGEPFGLAGLWERWRGEDGQGELVSFAIVTVPANRLAARVHPRMPAILAPEAEALWLDPGVEEAGRLQGLLAPAPEGELEARAVTGRCNTPAREGSECLEPLPAEQDLFRSASAENRGGEG